jgi:phage shock protein A
MTLSADQPPPPTPQGTSPHGAETMTFAKKFNPAAGPIAVIDLRRDLPKVREQWEAIIAGRGKCQYASPCIVGAMIAEDARAVLDNADGDPDDSPNISRLAAMGAVTINQRELDELFGLQTAFDAVNVPLEQVEEKLSALEAKYAELVA